MSAVPVLERLRQLPGCKGRPEKFTARCPNHEDRENSLSVSQADDGKILLYCHAGCSTPDILAALGMGIRDLSPPKPRNAKLKQKECTYDYIDADGDLVFQVVRYSPKSFRQCRPDPEEPNSWIWNLNGIERPLYRLPEVLRAKKNGDTIYLCEGEKDVDNLRAIGLCATTNSGGAAKWDESYAKTLSGANVVVLPDNDQPGIEAAWRRADSIPGAIVCPLPGLPEKGDVSDWLDQGGTSEGLASLVVEARKRPTQRPAMIYPTSKNPAVPDVDPLSELASAYRLRECHGSCLRHHSSMGWLVWDGRRWKRGEKLAKRRAHSVGAIIRKETLVITDSKIAGKYFSAAIRAESAAGIKSVLAIAATLEGIDANETEFDADPWVLNFRNGTLNLKTGELREHRQEDYITKLIPYDYNPKAQCPRWLQFLDEVFQGDQELIAYLQWALGYSCTGDVSAHVFFMMHGTGRNGKGALIRAIHSVLGSEYATTLNPEELLVQKHARNQTAIAALQGARFVSCQETDKGRNLNEAQVKTLTGGDRLKARYLFKDEFEFEPTFKIWLATNHKPKIDGEGATNNLWDRLRLIPFLRKFEAHEKDTNLDEKLASEAPGIIAWLVAGARRAVTGGEPAIPDCVRTATADYQRESDSLAEFLEEVTEQIPMATVSKSKLHDAYCEWSRSNVDYREFNKRIAARGISEKRTSSRMIWTGLTLRSESGPQENSM